VLYVPAEHCEHEEDPEEEYVPALQVKQLVAPAKEEVPAEQDVQDDDPDAVL
jgi:hypothetical protein